MSIYIVCGEGEGEGSELNVGNNYSHMCIHMRFCLPSVICLIVCGCPEVSVCLSACVCKGETISCSTHM